MTLPAAAGLDLIDPERLQQLCDHLFEAFGIAASIITTGGTLIARSGRNSVCNLFYHRHPGARSRCAIFDGQIVRQMEAGRRARIFSCRHGIMEIATPLLVDGKIAGVLFGGQFFCSPPGSDQILDFAGQAERYGFDRSAFIQAVRKLPVIPRSKSRAVAAFLSQLAFLVGDLAHCNNTGRQRAIELEKLNKALKTILDNRAIEKRAVEADLMMNVRKFILPYLDRLEKCTPDNDGQVVLNVIRSNIDTLLPPLTGSLASCYRILTPAQCRVADLVRQGLSTKQIARSLYLSPHTVTNIRNAIRKKLGLTGRKQSLKTFFDTIQNNQNA